MRSTTFRSCKGVSHWLAMGLIYAMLPQPEDSNLSAVILRPFAKLTDSTDEIKISKLSLYMRDDLVMFLSFPDQDVSNSPVARTRVSDYAEEQGLLEPSVLVESRN
ncbi:hypothetical protein R1flu_023545 [Riccia fluitans]|uniref:Uncharacterized protein n=1 Tax=Riccia fluitans TaxID=41844 RepID=A0ABD1XT54_9MARC